jgi:hypothetical protein
MALRLHIRILKINFIYQGFASYPLSFCKPLYAENICLIRKQRLSIHFWIKHYQIKKF